MREGEVFVFDVRICQSYQMTIALTIRQPLTVGWEFYCVVANLHLGWKGNFLAATAICQSVGETGQTD